MSKFSLLVLIGLLIFGNLAWAQPVFMPTHFVVGEVAAENEAILNAAQGKPIRLSFEGNPNYLEDNIGTGQAKASNTFMFNACELSPLASWAPGKKLTVFLPIFTVDGVPYAGITTIETTASGADLLATPVEIVEAYKIIPDENPKIQVSVSGPINFSIKQNSPNLASASFKITNIGKLELNPSIEISPAAGWLSVVNEGAPLTLGQNRTILLIASAIANNQALEPGIYATNLIIKDKFKPLVTPVILPVILTVTLADISKPVIDIFPDSLTFLATQDSDNPPHQQVILGNIGGGTLKPEITASPAWIQMNLPSPLPNLTKGQTLLFNSNCNITGLAADLYAGSIAFKDQLDPQVTAKNMPVNLTVMAREEIKIPVIATLPDKISFFAVKEGGLPPAQVLKISNIGTGTLNFQISGKPAWLLVSPQNGTLNPAQEESLYLSINTTQLDAGKYSALLNFNDKNNPQVKTVTVEIVLTITDPEAVLPIIAILPEQFSFQAVLNSAPTAPQYLEITNVGGGILSPALSKENNVGWLEIAPASTSLAAGESLNLALSCNPENLSPNLYSEAVQVKDANHETGVNAKTSAVLFTVTDPNSPQPILAVTPQTLAFTAVLGQANPSPQSFAIANVGTGTLQYTIHKAGAVTWLSVSPAAGTLAQGQSTASTVLINISGLSVGNYLATLEVKDQNTNQKNVTIALTITPPVEDPNGEIKNLRIGRIGDISGSALKIEWETDPAGLIIDLYTLIGSLEEESLAWQKIVIGQALTEYTLSNQVGLAPNELYVKVVPTKTLPAKLKEYPTVGKFNVTIKGGGKYSLISTPLLPQPGNTLDQAMGKQLNSGSLSEAHLIFGWDGTGFSYGSYLSPTGWKTIPNNTPVTIDRGKGYFVYSQPTHPDKVLTLTGKISKVFSLSLPAGYSLIGNPYPASLNLDATGFAISGAHSGPLSNADLLFGWDGTGYSLGAYLSPTGWKNIPGNQLPAFEKGKGYFYYINPVNSGFTWKENK